MSIYGLVDENNGQVCSWEATGREYRTAVAAGQGLSQYLELHFVTSVLVTVKYLLSPSKQPFFF